jgi:hypothetical protein
MKWWEHIDFASVGAILFHKGKKRYVTAFGLVISITSYITIAVLSLLMLIYYFKKTEINV